jgi:two-component system sensor histidine kinase/response regulator
MSTLKILVVDDEPGIRSGVTRILRNFRVDYPFMEEAYDFEVFEASTGEAGIEMVESNQPDILLLDNKLPGIQGIEVLEYIKKKQYNIIVPKPFTPQELKSSIENITKKVFLKKMTTRLQESGKQVRFQFLSVLSHELKTPLNAIDGYLKMIRERQLGAKIEDYDEAIERSLDRIRGMRTLILDLLDLTKVETSRGKRNIREVNVPGIVRTAIDTMQPYSIQKEVNVSLAGPESLTIQADPNELEIICNNLISNAIKYNKEGGSVHCELADEGDRVGISVTDTGIGMTPAEMEKLFQDFVRIKNEKTRNITGSGLGLSIVKKLVESYNGKIEVSSTPDQGSIFKVFIPKVATCS